MNQNGNDIESRLWVVAKELEGAGGGRRKIGPADYQARGVLYLPDAARFSALIQIPEGGNLGKERANTFRHVQHPALLPSSILFQKDHLTP